MFCRFKSQACIGTDNDDSFILEVGIDDGRKCAELITQEIEEAFLHYGFGFERRGSGEGFAERTPNISFYKTKTLYMKYAVPKPAATGIGWI